MGERLDSSPAHEVAPGLLLGSLRSLGLLDTLSITHVVSVVNFDVARNLDGYHTLRVHLRDDEGANLLKHLPAAYAFIHDALSSGGRVLVHCQAGVSRSPALAAAYIMKAQHLTAAEALQLIKSKSPSASPNEGFLAQLGLFQDMKCSLDEEHPVYRMWNMEQVARYWEENGYVDPDAFAQLPEDGARAQQGALYRCRKCRRLLATAKNVLPVEAAAGHRLFRSQKLVKTQAPSSSDNSGSSRGDGGAAWAAAGRCARQAGQQQAGPGTGVAEESSLFVEPMAWMANAVVGALQGKLYCPGCSARLGSFNWSGISNEHGQWVTPAFQLHMSKLDVIKAVMLTPVRRPFIAPAAPAPAPAPAPAAMSAAPAPAPGPAAPAAPASASATPVPGSAAATAATGSTLHVEAISLAEPLAGSSTSCVLGMGAVEHRSDDATASSGNYTTGPTATTTSTTSTTSLVPTTATTATAADSASPDTASKSSGFQYLILDCDGVMVDTERASCESLRQAILQATGFDIPHQFPEDYYPVFGMDVRSCVAYYKEQANRHDWVDVEAVAQAVLAAKEGHYRRLTADGIQAFAGARELILHARKLGMGVAVASSGAPEKIRHNLRSSGLMGLVDEHLVVSTAYVAKGKPAPDVYLEAMRRLGCTTSSQALVIEDAVNGLKAAGAAGAFCVGISNSLPRDRLEAHADLVIDQLSELDLANIQPLTQ